MHDFSRPTKHGIFQGTSRSCVFCNQDEAVDRPRSRHMELVTTQIMKLRPSFKFNCSFCDEELTVASSKWHYFCCKKIPILCPLHLVRSCKDRKKQRIQNQRDGIFDNVVFNPIFIKEKFDHHLRHQCGAINFIYECPRFRHQFEGVFKCCWNTKFSFDSLKRVHKAPGQFLMESEHSGDNVYIGKKSFSSKFHH